MTHIQNNAQCLNGSWQSWLPIWIPVAGVLLTVGMYIMLLTTTAQATKENYAKIILNEKSMTSNEKRIIRLEECQMNQKEQYIDIKSQIMAINTKLDKLLMK